MKLLITRIREGVITVKDEVVASTGPGAALFTGIAKTDKESKFLELARKAVHLRIFEDDQGKMNRSLLDTKFEILCVPNFTLCARAESGRRPSFDDAMRPELARQLFDDFAAALASWGIPVSKGIFGEHMEISLTLDGPVNILLES